MKKQKIKIGILGGSFDPAHKGHLSISKYAIKKFKLKSLIWAITNQNPFKKKSENNLNKRIIICKNIIGKNKSIKVKFFENIIRSKVGYVIPTDNLTKIPDIIKNIEKDPISENIGEILSKTVYNVMQSSKIGANVIEDIHNEISKDKKFS